MKTVKFISLAKDLTNGNIEHSKVLDYPSCGPIIKVKGSSELVPTFEVVSL